MLRNQLSTTKRKFHLNVTRRISKAHQQTLVHWIRLLSSEREAMVRKSDLKEKCHARRRQLPIIKFFSTMKKNYDHSESLKSKEKTSPDLQPTDAPT